MCTSTDDCFCQEQVRQSRSPNCSYAQRSRSSAEIVSGGSRSAWVAKQDLLQRVAAQAQPERLERDDLLGRDVAEVDLGTEVLDALPGQPALVLVELVPGVDDLEEGPTDDDGLLAEHLELPLQVARHPGRAPAELDDVDVLAGGLEDVLPCARAEALVEDVR